MRILPIVLLMVGLLPLMAIEYGGIPDELQGRYPIHEPRYEGVDQLLVLSARWVIVATKNIDDVIEEADALSGHTLLKTVERWERSEKEGRPDWGAYRERWAIRDKYIAQARENIGERLMDAAGYYGITSQDDERYRASREPLRVTRVLVPLDGSRVKGSHDMDYAHYTYLELPATMESGKTYTVTLANGKSVSFLYDEMLTVSRAIKINQVGYAPSAQHKYAYLGCHLFEFGALDLSAIQRFDVVDAHSGTVVLSGAPVLRGRMQRFLNADGSVSDTADLISGEDVYEIDFGAVRTSGVYFIRVPGVGRSWPFEINEDVYGNAFFVSMRGLYHQRASFALDERYTPWSRARHHAAPIYESEAISGPRHGGGFAQVNKIDQNQFDIIGGSIDRTRATTSVEGGWYDAADWDRNEAHYNLIFDMLTVYDAYPGKFTDGQLAFNESGNGIPDILDEVEWGLRIWRYSQDERGGISGKVETWTHPKIDAEVDYAFSQRTRWTSLVYAAAAAHYARSVRPFNQEHADIYAESAKKAYAFGADDANRMVNVVVHGKKNRGKGDPFTVTWTEEDALSYPYLCHAKLRLYLLTGDEDYLDGLEDISKKAQRPFSWRFTHCDWSAWIYQDILTPELQGVLSQEIVKFWRQQYYDGPPVGNGTNGQSFVGENLISVTEAMPYRNSLPLTNPNFGWGSSITTNRNRAAFIAHRISGDERFRDVMRYNADFCFGANPMGMCWTTGLGFTYPVVFQHEQSTGDGIMDPVPGITLYGITSGPRFHYFRNNVWYSPTGEKEKVAFMKEENMTIPAFRRWGAHPMLNTAKCEFTIHETVSSTLFTAACLMPEGWMPPERLRHMKPRKDEALYGYWYLP